MASTFWKLEGFIEGLESWGLTDVMLPFLLIFTIIFAVLEKSKLLGAERRNLNTVIALVISLITVIPHITGTFPSGMDPVEIMNNALPSVSIVIVAIIMLLILIGLFGQEQIFLGLSMPGWVAFVSLVVILIIFGGAAGWWAEGFTGWMSEFFGDDGVAIVLMILVFGVIIAFITGGEGERDRVGAAKRLGIDWSKMFGGGK